MTTKGISRKIFILKTYLLHGVKNFMLKIYLLNGAKNLILPDVLHGATNLTTVHY